MKQRASRAPDVPGWMCKSRDSFCWPSHRKVASRICTNWTSPRIIAHRRKYGICRAPASSGMESVRLNSIHALRCGMPGHRKPSDWLVSALPHAAYRIGSRGQNRTFVLQTDTNACEVIASGTGAVTLIKACSSTHRAILTHDVKSTKKYTLKIPVKLLKNTCKYIL